LSSFAADGGPAFAFAVAVAFLLSSFATGGGPAFAFAVAFASTLAGFDDGRNHVEQTTLRLKVTPERVYNSSKSGKQAGASKGKTS
jgi:hypothetical protein